MGMYAIQLAKVRSPAVAFQYSHLKQSSGARVVSTASPKNHELVKSFGADEVFDYRDPEVAEKIRDWAGESPISGGLE